MAARANPITGVKPQPKEESDDAGGDFAKLKLRQMRGFNGSVLRSLTVHPSGSHLIYVVGSNIIVEKITKKHDGVQEILSKHVGDVSAMCLSPDGRYIASGDRVQTLHASHVILWDFETREPLMDMTSHKTYVESICFLADSHHFVSLGSDEDGKLTLWSTLMRCAKISELAVPLRARATKCVAASKANSRIFISGGAAQGRIWNVSDCGNKLEHKELNFAYKRHNIVCIEVADKDCSDLPMAFCGTSSGDILIFSMTSGNIQAAIPKKPIPNGITSVAYVRMIDATTFSCLVGTGDGKVINYDITLNRDKHNHFTAVTKLGQGTNVWSYDNDSSVITSIVKKQEGNVFYVGTSFNHIYEFNLFRWTASLVRTNSSNPIYALAFARGTDDLLVTGECGQVRVINLQVSTETRRYLRHNRTCYSAAINHDGTQIFTGWDTGDVVVLGFRPACMTLMELYRIDSAQKQPVSSLALTSESSILVTGGGDGQTRVWRLVDDLDHRGQRLRQGLLHHQLTFNAGTINTIEISQDDKRCLSSSQDGSAVVYDLASGHRVQSVKWDTSLNAACFVSGGLQLLTCSGDGVIRYWEVADGALIRQIPGSKFGAINTISMRAPKCPAIQQFATGGDDGLVKVWDFEKAVVTHVGRGHSSGVIASKFGPCGSILVTSSRDGALCIWDVMNIVSN